VFSTLVIQFYFLIWLYMKNRSRIFLSFIFSDLQAFVQSGFVLELIQGAEASYKLV
jgi:hypothetical protein